MKPITARTPERNPVYSRPIPSLDFLRPRQKRPWSISFSVSVALHILALIGTAGISFSKAPEFGIKGSAGSMEIYMVAAMPGYSSKAQPQKATASKAPEMTKTEDGMMIEEPHKAEKKQASSAKNEDNERKSSRHGKRSAVKGDGSSPTPGQSVTTLYSVGSAATSAKPGLYQNEAPRYPPLAQERKQEGVVLLHVRVDKQGNPNQIEIKKSSGHSLLDSEARKAVQRWRFEAGRLGNAPIDSEIDIPIRFSLEN